MTDENNKHRRSIRLPDYDYSTPGAYFVTICAQDGASRFGEIIDGEMHLNSAGDMVSLWWGYVSSKYSNVATDEAFVIMPNHFHGIIIVGDATVGADQCVCPSLLQTEDHKRKASGEHTGSPLRSVVQWFKTMTTNAYIHGVKEQGWTRFDSRLWQRNYYEHVIRNERELERVREYIAINPLRWEFDSENPSGQKEGKGKGE